MSGLRSDQNIKLRMLTHRLPQQEDGLGLVVGPQAVVARPSAARIDGDKRGGKKGRADMREIFGNEEKWQSLYW
jgi:hypothetical protein